MIDDLRRFVERELTGRMRRRGGRLIAGLSMGGFGSLMLALRHPRLFRGAGSLSGAVRPIGDWRKRRLGGAIFGPISSDPRSRRRRHDPATLIEQPARVRRLALYLDCGRADALLAMNRKLHRKLARLGIEHAWHEYAGDHTWPSWRKRLPHALRYLAGRRG
jgi:S-formylglutathione hydrolase FrmB